MPNSNWFKRYSIIIGIALAALLITLAVLAVLWGLERQVEYERYADERRKEYTNNTYSPERQRCFGLAAGLQHDCVTKARNEATAYNREQQDLVAQRVTALWTKLMGGAAIIGMVLSAFGVFLVYTTFNATRQSNIIAREAMVAQNRAWLNIKSVSVHSIIITPDTINIVANFMIENSGQSPALNTVLKTDFLADSFTAFWPLEVKREITDSPKYGLVVFPNTPRNYLKNDSMDRANVVFSMFFFKTNIQYETAGSGKVHTTQTQFRIAIHDPLDKNTFHGVPLDVGPIDISKFTVDVYGNVFAT